MCTYTQTIKARITRNTCTQSTLSDRAVRMIRPNRPGKFDPQTITKPPLDKPYAHLGQREQTEQRTKRTGRTNRARAQWRKSLRKQPESPIIKRKRKRKRKQGKARQGKAKQSEGQGTVAERRANRRADGKGRCLRTSTKEKSGARLHGRPRISDSPAGYLAST